MTTNPELGSKGTPELRGPTSSRLGQVVVGCVLVLFAAVPFVPSERGLASFRTHGWLLSGLLIALLVGAFMRSPELVHLSLLASSWVLVFCLPFVGELWPLPLVCMLLVYGALIAFSPWLRNSAVWWRRGRIDRTTIALIVAFAVTSGVALVAWRFWTSSDLGAYRNFVPDIALRLPKVVLLAGIVLYAMLNAVVEEVVWRGAMLEACRWAFNSARVACLVQAASFGLMHYRGFPSGAVGVGLASIYGVMTGVLRLRSGGLLAPWLAHVAADTVIYALVAWMVIG